MGQETGSFIDDLNSAWPLDTDQRRFGAEHLRLIKRLIQATFPGINGAVLPTLAELNQLSGFDVAAIDALTLSGQLAAFYRDADNLNAGTLDNARVTVGNVTQYQANLEILSHQVSAGVQTKNASFTVNTSMDEDIVICDKPTTINITLNGGVLATGHSTGFIRRGVGAVNFLAGPGQTINTPNGTSILLQHGKAVATYIETNTWELSGNL
jgi:hypothetical protein